MLATETVFMFSGQGSQYYQMGRALFEENKAFRQWMRRLDDIVCDLAGHSVIQTLYSDARQKIDLFNLTMLSHPAIFMVEYALAQTLIEADVVPDITLGASVGSFAAAAISGFIGMEEALSAVIQHAKMLEEYCMRGAMVAVLADSDLYLHDQLRDYSEIAAFNFSTHFAVATKHSYLEGITAFLRGRGVSFQLLPVVFAFHSRWIDEAEKPYRGFLRSLSQKPGNLPIACCAESRVLHSIPGDFLWNVTRAPIRFQNTISLLESRRAYRYIDIGPSGTLATFLKYLLPSTSRSKVFATLTPFGRDIENVRAITARC